MHGTAGSRFKVAYRVVQRKGTIVLIASYTYWAVARGLLRIRNALLRRIGQLVVGLLQHGHMGH
jgi:hypothetical protein